MGRSITTEISETITPRRLKKMRCGKKSREKRDYTKSGKGSFLEEKEGNSWGI